MLTYVMRICNTIIATIILHKREKNEEDKKKYNIIGMLYYII